MHAHGGARACAISEQVSRDAGISPTDDEQCLGGAATTGEPGALMRGGVFGGLETQTGPFTINAGWGPSAAFVDFDFDFGFCCAR